MKENETFYLDTDTGSEECKVITTMYSETRKKYYVIYESLNNQEDLYVSSYNPNEKEGILEDIKDEE